MKKMKIVSMLIVAMFVGLAATTISGAEYLNADIKVKVEGFIGLVSPIVNATSEEQKNQTVEFLVNVTEPPGDEKNNSYKVKDKLIINITIDDTSDRIFVLPRFVFCRVIVVRDLIDAIRLPGNLLSLFRRWQPIREPFRSVGVVDTFGGGQKATNISIDVDYEIINETFHNGENLTMYISVMGFLPGDVNGILDGELPIINKEIINLKVKYKDNEA